jgi:hypothetical protein
MWVTRQLVEKHGGTMRVYSSTTPGRSGTVFRMVFPEPHAVFKSSIEIEAEESALWNQSAEKTKQDDEIDDFGPDIMSA